MKPITPLGWAVTGAAVACLLAGVLLGWAELVAAGVLLAVVVLAALVQAWGSSAYRVQIELAARRVTQGQRVGGRVLVRSVARRRLLPSVLELPVGDAVAIFPVPSLAPGALHEATFRVPTERRAVLTVGPAASVRSDAIGILRRRRTWSQQEQIVVHPRTVALSGGTSGLLRDLDGAATTAIAEVSLAFHALREYTPGDDVRRIHWRSTARTGQVMVRQDEDVRRTRCVVVLATAEGENADRDAFDLAVGVAASWAVQAARAGHDLAVHAGRELPRPSATAVLDACAGVIPSPRGLNVTEAARWVARQHADASLVVLVAGAGAEVGALRAALSTLPVHATRIAVSARPGQPLAVESTQGRTLARCGALAQLPRIARRVLS